MATPGQPTLYKPEYRELAHNYCLLGATNEVLGDFFGVTSRTIDNWIATHPDFADAVRRGRAVADAVVVRALFERAKGFSHQVSRTWHYPCRHSLKRLKRHFSVAMAPENSIDHLKCNSSNT